MSSITWFPVQAPGIRSDQTGTTQKWYFVPPLSLIGLCYGSFWLHLRNLSAFDKFLNIHDVLTVIKHTLFWLRGASNRYSLVFSWSLAPHCFCSRIFGCLFDMFLALQMACLESPGIERHVIDVRGMHLQWIMVFVFQDTPSGCQESLRAAPTQFCDIKCIVLSPCLVPQVWFCIKHFHFEKVFCVFVFDGPRCTWWLRPHHRQVAFASHQIDFIATRNAIRICCTRKINFTDWFSEVA